MNSLLVLAAIAVVAAIVALLLLSRTSQSESESDEGLVDDHTKQTDIGNISIADGLPDYNIYPSDSPIAPAPPDAADTDAADTVEASVVYEGAAVDEGGAAVDEEGEEAIPINIIGPGERSVIGDIEIDPIVMSPLDYQAAVL